MKRYIQLFLLMTVLLLGIALGGCGSSEPEKLVKRELGLIQKLDEKTIETFISYDDMTQSTEDTAADTEATEAVKLFFKNFRYKVIHSAVQEQSAAVTVKITNIDTEALARDIYKAMITQSASLENSSITEASMADSFTLLRDCLLNNQYETIETQAVIPLIKQGKKWVIVNSSNLEDDLVSGFVSHLNDPKIVPPTEVVKIYLDSFRGLTAKEWVDYFHMEDIFATGSKLYPQIDSCMAEQISKFYNYEIISSETEGNTAFVKVALTSLSLEGVMNQLSRKLLEYASTTESIRATDEELAGTTAQYLLEALNENVLSSTTEIDIPLSNDGKSWSLELDDSFTDALLGDISKAVTILAPEDN